MQRLHGFEFLWAFSIAEHPVDLSPTIFKHSSKQLVDSSPFSAVFSPPHLIDTEPFTEIRVSQLVGLAKDPEFVAVQAVNVGF